MNPPKNGPGPAWASCRHPNRGLPLLRAAAATSVGQVRQNNEDAWFVDAGAGLFIVSDGMGGHQAGEVAAQMVTAALPKLVAGRFAGACDPGPSTVRASLRQDLIELSRAMYQQAAVHPLSQGMGATVVVALILGWRAYIAHLGDSRAYLFRSGQLTRLTEDHTLAGRLLRSGLISEAEAATHEGRAVLTRYMGMRRATFPDTRSLPLRPADRLLLCSDGISNMLTDLEIGGNLKLWPDPQPAGAELVKAANDAGGKDNATAVVVQIETRAEEGGAAAA
jgi:protein phosphatase